MPEFEKTNEQETSSILESQGGAYAAPPQFNLTTSGPVQRFESDQTDGGPGHWVTTSESMSANAATYQTHVTGKPANLSYQVQGVKFDGYKDGTLLEAKSGMENFVDSETGDFKDWFSGLEPMKDQAERQSTLAKGYELEWHFQKSTVAKAAKKEIIAPGLKILHDPN